MRVAGALSLLAIVASCSPRRGAEFLVLGGDVRRTPDIAYDSGARQRLDVYRIRGEPGPSPVVVFLYGGRWKHGEKRDYLLLATELVRRGWVVVIPDYRLYPEVIFPGWVADAATAVAWAAAHAPEFGGDTTRLFVVGHSAGAHTATILALDPRYLREAGAGTVRGFVSLAGPVDTTWTAPDVQRLMGPESGWPATYPAELIEGNEPPLLLLHGAGDDVVTVSNSVRLAQRIRRAGGCARAITYPAIGHIQIAVALGVPSLSRAPVLDDLARFIEDPGTACAAPAAPRSGRRGQP